MSSPAPVRLRSWPVSTAPAPDLVRDAVAAAQAGTPGRLAFSARWGHALPLPGQGQTSRRWEMLASVGSVDLTLARTLEPHADALAILAEAGLDVPEAETTWGVYAAEGPGTRVTAHERDGRWTLQGTKPWCSLAGQVSHTLVTAWVGPDVRGLFAVDLLSARSSAGGARARVEPVTWVSRGLADVVSGPVAFESCPASLVGGPGWYLSRDGFAWGGMGVAAIWYGASVALARQLRAACARRPSDQISQSQLGAVDLTLTGARAVLAEAAAEVDAGDPAGPPGAVLAQRVRGVVARAADQVLTTVGHALGPGPLTQDEEHARRVADLQVYVRQHHAERDAAALGRLLLDDDVDREPW